MTRPSSWLARHYEVCVDYCSAGEDSKLYGYESLVCTNINLLLKRDLRKKILKIINQKVIYQYKIVSIIRLFWIRGSNPLICC